MPSRVGPCRSGVVTAVTSQRSSRSATSQLHRGSLPGAGAEADAGESTESCSKLEPPVQRAKAKQRQKSTAPDDKKVPEAVAIDAPGKRSR